jgi:hypothetical protein
LQVGGVPSIRGVVACKQAQVVKWWNDPIHHLKQVLNPSALMYAGCMPAMTGNQRDSTKVKRKVEGPLDASSSSSSYRRYQKD